MPLQKVLLDVHGDALPSYTFTRSSSAYQIDSDGVLRLKSTDLLRLDYLDLDNDGERETPSIVVELASTNKFTRSIEFSHSTWVKTAVTAEANVGAAPDLSTQADMLLPSTVNSAHFVSQTATLTASTDHTVSVYASPAGYSYLTLHLVNSSAAAGPAAHFYLGSSGSVVDSTNGPGAGTHRRSHIERIRSGVYRCTLVATLSTSTGAEARIHVTQTSSQMAAAWAGAGTSGGLGVMLWGAQLEEAMPAETSLIASSAATLARGADVMYLPLPDATIRPVTVYVRMVERGGVFLGSNARVVQISDAAGTTPIFALFATSSLYNVRYDGGGVNGAQAALAAAPSVLNIVELRGVLRPDGSVLIGQSIDSATETTAETTNGPGLVASYSAARLYINSYGGTAPGMNRILDVKLAEGEQSMTYMRSLAPFWVIDGVAIPVAVDSVREERLEIGDRDRSFDGTLRETIRNRVGVWSGETQPLSMTDRVRALDALESSTQPSQTYGAMCRTSTGKLPQVHTRVTGEALIQSSTERRYVLSFTAEQSS